MCRLLHEVYICHFTCCAVKFVYSPLSFINFKYTGVGWSMSKKLNAMGIMTCEDLQKISLAALQKEFGPKTGQTLYKFCRGEDDRLIRTEKERKSVSAEINYGIRFQSVSCPPFLWYDQ